MELKEWSLIIFTIVMQMAIGSFVMLGGVHFFATRRNGMAEADRMADRSLLAIGPLVVLALLVTVFHLGNPLNAPRAISNFGSSWLSREIILAGTFSVLGAVFAFMQWRKLGSMNVRRVVGLVVALVGLVLVYAMAMIYQLPTVPAWNSPATVVTFYITTFLLGSLAIGAAFVANFTYLRGKKPDKANVQYAMLATTLRWLALVAIVLLGLHFVVIPLYLATLAVNPEPAAVASADVIIGQNGLLLAVRLVLLFLGAGVFAVFVYKNAASEAKLRVLGSLAYIAFALVLISEIMGRYLFYASMVRVGI
jgi:anaerobic dimethyl sulfoxide reductase subunit C (anchor subunit)